MNFGDDIDQDRIDLLDILYSVTIYSNIPKNTNPNTKHQKTMLTIQSIKQLYTENPI